MTTSQALDAVERLCGGDEGFHRVWKYYQGFAVDEWDRNLADLCEGRQKPEEYVKRAKEMYHAYRVVEFNRKFEETLVNSRERK